MNPSQIPLENTTVTLKKTLIGAVIALTAIVALGTRADAQETPTPEPTPEATTETTTTPEATTEATTTPEATTEATATPEATTEATTTPEATTEATTTPEATTEATTTPEATTAPADSGSGDQSGGANQLAFTGPDTRVMTLAVLLLGAGGLFLFAAHWRRERTLTTDSWVE